jgi:hypothetical protein
MELLWVLIGGAAVFIAAVFVYVLLMVFLPEWVGITGSTALKAEESHRNGEVAKDDDWMSKLHK